MEHVRHADEASISSELTAHWPVVALSFIVHLLLSGTTNFVPAVSMEQVAEGLGVTVASLGGLNSLGVGFKAGLTLFVVGPALDALGPHALLNTSVLVSCACAALLAAAPGPAVYSAAFVFNLTFNALAGEATFTVLYATFFTKAFGVSLTSIAAAFSVAGVLLPLLLSPVLAAYGWRVLWALLSGCLAACLPAGICILKPGPVSLRPKMQQVLELSVGAVTLHSVAFGARLKRQHTLSKMHGEDGNGGGAESAGKQGLFTGGKLSGTLASALVCADPDALARTIAQHKATLNAESQHAEEEAAPHGAEPVPGSPAATPSDEVAPKLVRSSTRSTFRSFRHSREGPAAGLSLEEALRSPKFWTMALACVCFFLYGGQLNLHLPTMLQVEGAAGRSPSLAHPSQST